MFNKWLIAIFASCMLLGSATAADEFDCLQCEGTDDCLKNVAAITATVPCSTKCFTKLNDQKVSRGCLTETDESTCATPDCITCETASCNKNNICKSCDSANNATCAQTDASEVKNEICENADSKCMTSVLESKTVRSCATDDLEKTCSADTKKCQTCEGAICNIGIFPTDRRTCHQCADTSTECANIQSSDSSAALPCLLYVENDKCYMYGSDETHVTRGCTSDADATNKCSDTSTDDKCKSCETNNCNSWSYKMDQSLLCITCSSQTDATCIWGQLESGATSCTNTLLYTEEGKCYTRNDADGVVTRGCFVDLDTAGQTACNAGTNCTLCSNANGCNNVDDMNFTCIRCRSDNNADCDSKVDAIGGEKCRNLLTSDAEAKCFAGIWNTGVVIRGCLVDLELRDQFTCNNPDSTNCYVCNETNCNTAHPNGATFLLLSNALLAFALFTLWRLK